jgi:hypothetical protein
VAVLHRRMTVAVLLGALVATLLAVAGPSPAAQAEPIDTWDEFEGIDCVGERFNPIQPDGKRDPLGDPEPGTEEWDEQQEERVACATQRNRDRLYHPPQVNAWAVANYGQDWYREPQRFDQVRFRYSYFPLEQLEAAGLGIPGVAAAEIYRPCAPGTCSTLPAGLERSEAPYPVVVLWHGGAAQMKHHRFTAQMLAERGYLAIVLNGVPVGGVPNFPDGAMGPAVLDWLASEDSGVYGRDADLDRVAFAGHSLGSFAALESIGDPRVDTFIAYDSFAGSGDIVGEDNCVDDNPCQPIMYQRTDGAFSAPQDGTRDEYPSSRDWGLEPYLAHTERGMDVMHVTLRATNHIDWNGNGVGVLAGNRYAEQVINYYTLAWLDRHVMGKLVVGDDGEVVTQHGRTEAEEREHRQQIVEDAYRRLIAQRFDETADLHNVSMGFWNPVAALTSGDALYGGNTPYTLEGLWTTDRLATDFRSYCSVSVPNYTDPDGPEVLARADTGAPSGDGPADDMRIHGCPEVFRHQVDGERQRPGPPVSVPGNGLGLGGR